ncbi:hypothetical protein N8083_02305 [Candidatus Pacebacteria bacterium]|nr:hypothetical protein [Candidatus Paceibacterota bacterium]
MTFAGLVGKFLEIINVLVLVVFAVTLVILVWQMINAWIIHGGESTAIEEGKKTILTGFIVLIVMASVWGIVALLQGSFV